MGAYHSYQSSLYELEGFKLCYFYKHKIETYDEGNHTREISQFVSAKGIVFVFFLYLFTCNNKYSFFFEEYPADSVLLLYSVLIYAIIIYIFMCILYIILAASCLPVTTGLTKILGFRFTLTNR